MPGLRRRSVVLARPSLDALPKPGQPSAKIAHFLFAFIAFMPTDPNSLQWPEQGVTRVPYRVYDDPAIAEREQALKRRVVAGILGDEMKRGVAHLVEAVEIRLGVELGVLDARDQERGGGAGRAPDGDDDRAFDEAKEKPGRQRQRRRGQEQHGRRHVRGADEDGAEGPDALDPLEKRRQ